MDGIGSISTLALFFFLRAHNQRVNFSGAYKCSLLYRSGKTIKKNQEQDLFHLLSLKETDRRVSGMEQECLCSKAKVKHNPG